MLDRQEPFSERLKMVMDEKHIRAVDLAKAIGVSEGTISQYRSGYTEPKRDRLVAIADYLRVSPLYLMGIVREPTRSKYEDGDKGKGIDVKVFFDSTNPDKSYVIEHVQHMSDSSALKLREYAEFLIQKENEDED